MTCEYVMQAESGSRGELCKERLIGKVCGSCLRAGQSWTATEANMRHASAQEVERHVGNSSAGPTLRTQRERFVWRCGYCGDH